MNLGWGRTHSALNRRGLTEQGLVAFGGYFAYCLIGQPRRSVVLKFSDAEAATVGKQPFSPHRTALLIVECVTKFR